MLRSEKVILLMYTRTRILYMQAVEMTVTYCYLAMYNTLPRVLDHLVDGGSSIKHAWNGQ